MAAPKWALSFALSLGQTLVDFELDDITETAASAELVDLGFDFDVACHLLDHIKARKALRAPLPKAA